MIYLRLAWRNIWRNSRRTWITVASIGFAVILSTLLWAMLEGVYANMIHNVVSFSTGYLQVHKAGYWKEKSIENVFTIDSVTEKKIAAISSITAIVPRIENFALASTGEKTSGVMLLGIDPVKENAITALQKTLQSGNYLQAGSNGVLIGSGLAGKLQLKVGDSLIILSQGYQASSANGLFPITGIIKLGSPELDKMMVCLSLENASSLLNLNKQITSWAIMINDQEDLQTAKQKINTILDPQQFEVMDWKQMLPELDQMITADGSGHKITLLVLYMVISFGIFSTILMMLAERRHEFGIILAIGMQKSQIARIVFLETLMICCIGIIAGTLASIPVLQYFTIHPIRLSGELGAAYQNYGFEPIIPVSMKPAVFISQARIVFLITFIISIYPIYKILRLNLMTALRS